MRFCDEVGIRRDMFEDLEGNDGIKTAFGEWQMCACRLAKPIAVIAGGDMFKSL